jgi:protein TonB
MFEDSLFASSARRHQRRGWAALVSFAVQTILIGLVVVVPMLFTDVLPLRALKRIVEVPAGARPTQSENQLQPQGQHQHPSNIENGALRVPRSILRAVIQVVDPPPLADTGNRPSVSSTSPGGSDGNQLISILLSAPRPVTPTIAKPSPLRWKVSGGVERGLLVREVTPLYPPLARQARIQGEVVLQAIIGKDGRIQNLHAISGNPLLIPAALDAVQGWRYRPYLLNGEPVEVETQITVNFKLS